MKQQIAQLMDELAPLEAFNDTALPDVRIHKSSHGLQREPLCYRQGIIIVGNGAKKIHLGSHTYHYNPDNYLVLTVPLPAECEAIATPEDPLLAMMIDIDLTVLHEIITEMESANRSFDSCPKGPGLFVSRSTHEIHDASLRLLSALQSPDEARIIGPGVVRELLYRIMCSENGNALYSLATKNSNLARIDRALKQIHSHYNEPMDVDELASIVNMSPSSFHRTFKQVTGTSPIQYLKRIRLDKARSLFYEHGFRVNEVARKVGYESSTQFSREFKRIFGHSPADVLKQVS
ncbi:MAG: AraC family transcriptional regulator [Puniceicoccaceae bacterium]|nr:AraC family transcriptional regulator [Puniceicoccaceae bacterium]|tara:strand:- start:681 stop:1553 length:873 start_codon:yes stop_codon:yes gene_type:complete